MSDMVRKNQKRWIIDQAIHETISGYKNDKLRKNAFLSLVEAVRKESDLLRPEYILQQGNLSFLKSCFQGLCNITLHYRDWIRLPAHWSTNEESLLKQFQSLVNHQFTNHSVPIFMLSAWLEEPGPGCWQKQTWYRHVGLGNNIRGANLPVKLTKTMAEDFMKSPDHFSIEQALTCSIYGFPEKVNPFYYGMTKKRRKWHIVNCNKLKQEMSEHWKHAAIADFKLEEENETAWSYRLWSIKQIRTRAELIEEGNELHHCVADYAQQCAVGETTIWSMKCNGRLTSHHSITIEVDPNERVIREARGKFNRWPTDQEQEIIQKWAEKENLQIAI